MATLERVLGPGSSEIFTKAPKILDRRQAPSFGYRAVHVVVFVQGLPVEIQVRTDLQHMWAETTERLADRWGRGIRYGSEPDDPLKDVTEGWTRRQFVGFLRQVAELVDEYERLQYDLDAAEAKLAFVDDPRAEELGQAVSEVREKMVATRDRHRSAPDVVSGFVEGLKAHE